MYFSSSNSHLNFITRIRSILIDCFFFSSSSVCAIGIGAFVYYLGHVLVQKLGVDDPLDAAAVHGLELFLLQLQFFFNYIPFIMLFESTFSLSAISTFAIVLFSPRPSLDIL